MANLFKEKPIVKVVMLKGQDGEEKLINQADGSGLSFWIGTQAEYDAIPEAELINNCVYYITDDTRDDFNTRLNGLELLVDNNTTAIADNTTDIATNSTNIINSQNRISQAVELGHSGTRTPNFAVAGVLSNNKKTLKFTVPIEKYPAVGYTINKVFIDDAIIRQNGNYIVGSAESDVNLGEASEFEVVGNSIIITWRDDGTNPKIDTANATNNDLVFILGKLMYLFAEV